MFKTVEEGIMVYVEEARAYMNFIETKTVPGEIKLHDIKDHVQEMPNIVARDGEELFWSNIIIRSTPPEHLQESIYRLLTLNATGRALGLTVEDKTSLAIQYNIII